MILGSSLEESGDAALVNARAFTVAEFTALKCASGPLSYRILEQKTDV